MIAFSFVAPQSKEGANINGERVENPSEEEESEEVESEEGEQPPEDPTGAVQESTSDHTSQVGFHRHPEVIVSVCESLRTVSVVRLFRWETSRSLRSLQRRKERRREQNQTW